MIVGEFITATVDESECGEEVILDVFMENVIGTHENGFVQNFCSNLESIDDLRPTLRIGTEALARKGGN